MWRRKSEKKLAAKQDRNRFDFHHKTIEDFQHSGGISSVECRDIISTEEGLYCTDDIPTLY